MAADKGCSPSQLVLGWLLAQGDQIIPIPGTRRITNLDSNAGAVDISLSAGELDAINNIFPPDAALGSRYA